MFSTRNEAEEDMLVELVKERDYMWNHNSRSYKNVIKRCRGWEEVAKIMYPKLHEQSESIKDETIKELKRKWKNNMDKLRRYNQHRETSDLDPAQKKFMEKYSFLFHAAKRSPIEKFIENKDARFGGPSPAFSSIPAYPVSTSVAPASSTVSAPSGSLSLEESFTNLVHHITQKHFNTHPTIDPFLKLLRGMLLSLSPSSQTDVQMEILKLVHSFQKRHLMDSNITMATPKQSNSISDTSSVDSMPVSPQMNQIPTNQSQAQPGGATDQPSSTW